MSLSDLQEPLRLLEQKEFDPAVEVLERKVAALPAHLGAYVLLAHAYEAQKRWTQALQAWEEVHLLLPNSPLAEAGKRRVFRRMEGTKADNPRTAPAPSPQEASSPPSAADEDELPESDQTMDTPDALDTPEDAPSDLEQLREQAEREARQGGARPGLANQPPSLDPDSSPAEDPTPTPEEQVEAFGDEDDEGSLDQLIDELESARIEPEPEADPDAPPPDPEAPAADDEGEEVVSETLARIHETQEDYETAAHIYDQLADQEPDRADEFQKKAAEMRAKADEAED